MAEATEETAAEQSRKMVLPSHATDMLEIDFIAKLRELHVRWLSMATNYQ